ncbi:MAG: hypothetical protein ACTHVM_06840 [Alkalibacterium gilvum]|uniref:Uncharacterized protein n=1 Tax=Alkalibacterium gilvum TaxID=1130080 RepID=A0A1H6TL70_9LACT|nr:MULTISPECIES: hypothetical protein [Alkalibacterium]MDN6293058.1 hypothetical protein [Alkalibacterium sp.]MDN6294864.1 hypothetical protein [Alkalibacterium sp.]MDN6397402.1 hypothetical protein [Alkalibacterium sp.]MDN6728887.1 hypothetical protein [Alkalibacterium sp.]SEI80813.1 hypothetical protein SAMN04488113_1223 [Alkalibacterium gilvum]
MNRQAENKHSIVHYLKKGYGTLFPAITNVQPQMPKEQISMFLKQAVKGKFPIVIQVNPTSQSDTIWEFKGTVSFSPKSTQVIVESDQKTITYLINAREIRHIRRLHKRK